VGAVDRSGLSPRTRLTPCGPVTLGAPEPLIIRRVYRSKREHSPPLFLQAVELAKLGGLDWEYLESESRYEKVEAELKQLRKAIDR
jgi:hypothetical protein